VLCSIGSFAPVALYPRNRHGVDQSNMECDREVCRTKSMTMVHHLSQRKRVSQNVFQYNLRAIFSPIMTVLTSAGGWRAITSRIGGGEYEEKSKRIHDSQENGGKDGFVNRLEKPCEIFHGLNLTQLARLARKSCTGHDGPMMGLEGSGPCANHICRWSRSDAGPLEP
jgi:hypothetical protein